eukprot:CAMPEP_0206616884 /NCGR_PEP_ID=MMETSP0325_2-20121206/59270_1 /ASSEMBLY_ACC=CAM_ASM_000347 /TAXON_ID=2866 /ORGANISM="Crypthecodinium cohnii, Strain Seligo" /LENGTH=102 /DNA_ID=CAMNT_0054138691 /DNA_START=15 /DNA_END=320 /DNA_ORIENTATION=-
MAAEDAGADAAEAGAERAESAEAETTAAVSRGDEPRQPIAAPTLLKGWSFQPQRQQKLRRKTGYGAEPRRYTQVAAALLCGRRKCHQPHLALTHADPDLGTP